MTSISFICSKCYKNIQKNCEIVCNVCQTKFHKLCANVDNERAVNALENFENIVYNCDNCLQSSCELIKKISLLAYQIEELKSMFAQFVNANNSENNNKSASHRSLPVLKTGLDSMSNLQSNRSTNLSSIENAAVASSSNASENINVLGAAVNVRNVAAVVGLDGGVVANNVTLAGGGAIGKMVMQSNVDEFSDAVSESVHDVNVNNARWNNVTTRKQRKARVLVVGDNNNTELDVVVQKKWVHLSSFKNTVTEDQIIDYVGKRLDIDKSHISCFKLVKKDVSVNDLKFVNFKLGVSPGFYDALFKPELWTADIKVRPFKGFPKKRPVQAVP